MEEATATKIGGVKVGTSMKIDEGVLDYELKPATSSRLGGIKVGTGLYIDDGVLNVLPQDNSGEKECSINIKNILKGSGTSESTDWSGGSGNDYELPIATTEQLGGVKIGNCLQMNGEILNVVLGTEPLTIEGGMWLSV